MLKYNGRGGGGLKNSNTLHNVCFCTYCGSPHVGRVRKMHIVEQEKNRVESVVLFRLSLFSSSVITCKNKYTQTVQKCTLNLSNDITSIIHMHVSNIYLTRVLPD